MRCRGELLSVLVLILSNLMFNHYINVYRQNQEYKVVSTFSDDVLFLLGDLCSLIREF